MKKSEYLKMAWPLIVALVLLALALWPAYAQAETHTPNQPGYWCEDGTKIDEYTGGDTWEADGNYDLVILKHGTSNTVFESVTSGTLLVTPDGKDISHIILCPPLPPPESTTTTVPSTTTTTNSPSSTITQPTTTTTVEGTTSTTEAPEESTTTTALPATTTTGPTPTELPFTGSHEGLVYLGALALIAGAGILAFGRE